MLRLKCSECKDPLPKDYPVIYMGADRLCRGCFDRIKDKERIERNRIKRERRKDIDDYDSLLTEK